MSTKENDTGVPVHYDAHDHATGVRNGAVGTDTTGFNTNGHANAPVNVNHNHQKAYDYGGNPLAHTNTGESARFPAFGGELQPGLYRPTTERKFANPAPLGLCGFALTTFILSLINLRTNGVTKPNVVVASAFAYGGLVQLLAGMWEMAVGNTFGATALSSYGGFWLSYAIINTPGGFEIAAAYSATDLNHAVGFFLFGWFIFTFIMLICTVRSTVAFFSLFLMLDLCYLMLAIGHFQLNAAGAPHVGLIKAGGVFGLLAAFIAWYNALAGIADTSNSFFIIPVAHFPWSDKGRADRIKTERETV